MRVDRKGNARQDRAVGKNSVSLSQVFTGGDMGPRSLSMAKNRQAACRHGRLNDPFAIIQLGRYPTGDQEAGPNVRVHFSA